MSNNIVINKVEYQTISEGEKWTIPSDGLYKYFQYKLCIFVNGSGNHPADIVHPDSTAEKSGIHIEAGTTYEYGPVVIPNFPAILASHGDIDVYVSYIAVASERT